MPFFKHLDKYADITFNDRKRLGPLDKAADQIMRGASVLTSSEKELIAAFVSGLNACHFCYGSHVAVATKFGVSAELIESLVLDLGNSGIDSSFRSLLLYVRKLTLTPAKVSQSDVDLVMKSGWSEQALYEAI